MKNLRPRHLSELVKSRKEGNLLVLSTFGEAPLRFDALEAKYGM